MATPLSMVFDILAIDRASTVFRKVGESATLAGGQAETGMAKIGGAMTRIAEGMTIAGAAAAVVSVKMAADFQQNMRSIQTQAGASKQELDSMSASVLKIASDVGTAPEALATSLYHIESVGLRGAQAMDVLRFAAEGAKVGNADLEQTTNALTAAVSSGLKGTEDYGKAMGALNTIVGIGDMKFQDLNAALSSGGLVVMKQYGVTLNDIGAALATFGDNNIRGADAMTALRMAVQGIYKPTLDGGYMLQSIGASAKKLQTDMQQHGLTYAVNELHVAMEKAGYSGSRAGEFITQAFGRRAGVGLLVLNGQIDRVNNKFEEMQRRADSFASDWQNTTKNANFQFDRLKTTVETLAIQLGNKLLPIVTSFMQYLADHQQVLQNAAVGIAGLFAAAAVYTIAANPLTWIIVGLGAIATLAVTAYDNFKPFHDLVNGVAGTIGNAASTAFTATSGFVAGALGKTPPSQQLPEGTNRSLNAKLMTAGGDTPLAAPTAGTFAGRGFMAEIGKVLHDDVLPKFREFQAFLVEKAWPAIQHFGQSMDDAWQKYGKPLAKFLGEQLLMGFKDIVRFWENSVWPTVKALAQAFGPVIMPVLGAFAAVFSVVIVEAFHGFAWLAEHVIGPTVIILGGFFIKVGVVIADAVGGIISVVKKLGDIVFTTVIDIGKAYSLLDPTFKAQTEKVEGWKTSFDGAMTDALDATHGFVDNANTKLDELLHPRTIKIGAELSTTTDALAHGGGTNRDVPAGHATGGAIHGPGSGTSDSILARLSNGEHVWTAREVSAAGGHSAVEAMRRSVIQGFAAGGPVLGKMAYPDPAPWAQGISDAANKSVQPLLPEMARQLMAAMATTAGGPGGAGGAAQWGGVVLQVLAMLGQSPSLLAGILSLINHESGGNPNAVNLTDSNAMAGHPSRGLMQTIPSTFYAYAGPFASRGINDPLANIYAGVSYALARYGPGMLAAGGRHSASGGYLGYEVGTGYVPVTGPAILHEGEAVIPANRNNSTGRGGGGDATFHLYDSDGVLMGTIHGAIDQRDRAAYQDARAR